MVYIRIVSITAFQAQQGYVYDKCIIAKDYFILTVTSPQCNTMYCCKHGKHEIKPNVTVCECLFFLFIFFYRRQLESLALLQIHPAYFKFKSLQILQTVIVTFLPKTLRI